MARSSKLLFAALLGLSASGADFDVARYGAKGDEKAVNTASIQKAIDAAAAKGTLVFKLAST